MNTNFNDKKHTTDNNKIYNTSITSGLENQAFSPLEELSMLQLGDSFFPTGMYTTSSGLEALYYDKKIKGKKEISEFIEVCLKYQIGPADCTGLSNAYEFAKEGNLTKVKEIDQILFSMKLVKEIRDASTRSGTQLLNCLLSFLQNNDLIHSYFRAIKDKTASGVYPIALALASFGLGIRKERACMILLYGFTVSVIGAALRLGILQHFESQQIIHELKPVMSSVINNNLNRDYSHLWQFSPGIDLVQMKHEGMDSKMFIT